MTIAGDAVSVSVTVHVPPDVAFEVFTTEIDRWWRRGIAYRVAGRRPGTLHLEGRLGGRIFEEYEGSGLHEVGRVTAWEPPARLAFEWRGANFAPGEVTYVEVAFRAVAAGTEVSLVHRGFAALRPDHPVRHGEGAVAFIRRLGLWWGQLLASYRDRAARE
jgi:uncharacterized protein YndB with AHSA1/START domain